MMLTGVYGTYMHNLLYTVVISGRELRLHPNGGLAPLLPRAVSQSPTHLGKVRDEPEGSAGPYLLFLCFVFLRQDLFTCLYLELELTM